MCDHAGATLMQHVARFASNFKYVGHLIKMWLGPVEETDDRGGKTRTTEARDSRRGGKSLHAPKSVIDDRLEEPF
jgi:hypothetical protein